MQDWGGEQQSESNVEASMPKYAAVWEQGKRHVLNYFRW
jgi:hypothetical protein